MHSKVNIQLYCVGIFILFITVSWNILDVYKELEDWHDQNKQIINAVEKNIISSVRDD